MSSGQASSNSRRSSRIKLPWTAASESRNANEFFYAADSLKLYGHHISQDPYDDDDDSGASILTSSNGSTMESSSASLDFSSFKHAGLPFTEASMAAQLSRKLSLDSLDRPKTPEFSAFKNDSGSFPDADLSDEFAAEKEETPTKSHDHYWYTLGSSTVLDSSRSSTCNFGRSTMNSYVTVIERRHKSGTEADNDNRSSGSSSTPTLGSSRDSSPSESSTAKSDFTTVSTGFSLFEDRAYDFNTWDNHTIKTFGIRVREIESPASETVVSSWTDKELLDNIVAHSRLNWNLRMQLDQATRNFQGHVRVHVNLIRPIRLGRCDKPSLIPRGHSKLLFLTSLVSSLDVISALLGKLNIREQPYKFALYEHSVEGDKSVTFRKLYPNESPITLVLSWLHNTSSFTDEQRRQIFERKRIVLQENESSLVNWSAFSIPELNNFLAILNKEEKEYIENIQLKYLLLKKEIRRRLKKAEKS